MPIVYGVDLGAHTVKISVLEGSFGRFQLTDVRTSAVPQSVQERPDTGRRLAVLRHLLEELQTERVQFACAYPAELTALRVVSLPFSDRAKVEQTLNFVIGDYVPFDLDDSILDHRSWRSVLGRARS
jgi:Tfp pilus assembly PilM family ATPase